jgi:hypothetical protein
MKQLLTTSFIALAITLAGLAAEATPGVGDKSVFAVTLTSGAQNMNGHLTMEITAYDAATDMWTVVTNTEMNGQKQSQTTPTKTADLIADASIDSMLSNCAGSGGKTDSVVSPAGTFPSCAVPISDDQSSGTLWISKVPFGYSKWTTTRKDGLIVAGILESFVAAPPKAAANLN